MSGPNLPVTINTTYADSRSDSTIEMHQQHHDIIHGILNKFDNASKPMEEGDVLVSDGKLFVSRALVASDVAAVITHSHTSSYSLRRDDAGTTVETNVASPNTLTVPSHAAVGFPIGTVIAVRQYGAGSTTVKGSHGVSIRSRGGVVSLAGRYAEATLTKRGPDEWVLVGDLV